MTKGKVVMIGLAASAVDFEKWPELSKEKLEAAFQSVVAELAEAGFDPAWCLIDTGETAIAQISQTLRRESPEVVLVGAGVRSDPEQFLLFEKAINVIHRDAPEARIVFNTSPFDSVDAVKRWALS